MASVKKSKVDLYQIRAESGSGSCAWADIVLVLGEKSVSVMITSDYGSFDYLWNGCGMPPKEFLCGLNFDYAMKKLTNYKLNVPDTEKYPDEIKERIAEALENECVTKEEASEIQSELLEICDEFQYSRELLNYSLYNHSSFEKIFGDSEALPSATTINQKAIDFWNDIWVHFIVELKKEI